MLFTSENYMHHSLANWLQISKSEFEKLQTVGKNHFVSDSGSVYFEFEQTIYRQSDHWLAAVADCAWFLDGCIVSSLCYAKNPLSGFKALTLAQAQMMDLDEASLRTFIQRHVELTQSCTSASTNFARSSDSCQLK